MEKIVVNVPGGIIKATKSCDPDYPGIDMEFIPDHPDGTTNFRMLMESDNGIIRGHVWSDPHNEDPTESFG